MDGLTFNPTSKGEAAHPAGFVEVVTIRLVTTLYLIQTLMTTKDNKQQFQPDQEKVEWRGVVEVIFEQNNKNIFMLFI